MRQLRITKQITNRQDFSLDKYLNEIGRIGLVTAEEEVELAIRIREGDQEALNKLTQANLRFVVSVAKQYQQQGLPLSDLISEGNVGLVKAALKFDETRGFKFISYAVWWIRQAIVQAISENSRMVRLPLNKITALNKIKKANASFEQEHNRMPSAEELVQLTGVGIVEVELCLKSSGRHISMDKPTHEDSDLDLHSLIASDEFPKPDTKLLVDSLHIDMNAMLNTLSKREAEVIRMLYGIGFETSMSMTEIGDILGISRERVRQIKEMAIVTIKTSNRSDILLKYLG